MHTPILLVCVAAILTPVSAAARCDCLCLDGRRATVCTTLEEASLQVNACAGQRPDGCPVNLAAPPARGYPAPEAGAVNCRDAQVYEPGAGDHSAVRVCDVEPVP